LKGKEERKEEKNPRYRRKVNMDVRSEEADVRHVYMAVGGWIEWGER